MKNFFIKIWAWIAVFFAGIIAGLVTAIRLQQPATEITNNTEIGKVKNKGEGTTQHVTQAPDQSTDSGTSKAKRQARKTARKRERKNKQSSDDEV